MTYDLTNNLYIAPSVGVSLLSATAKTGAVEATDEKEGKESISVTGSDYGCNLGTDLVYKANNGLSFGVSGRYVVVNGGSGTQIQGKVGFSF